MTARPESPLSTVRVHFTMDEASEILGVSRRWLQDFLKDKTCYRLAGHRKLFAEADIQILSEAMKCRSSSLRQNPAARRSGASGGHISGSTLTEARRADLLPTRVKSVRIASNEKKTKGKQSGGLK